MPRETNLFDDLDALRLGTDDAALAGAREVLSHVPVRKPGKAEFVRVHPDQAMSFDTAVYEDKEERETFLVAPGMRGELAGELRPVLLLAAITTSGTLFLWPVPLPDGSGRRSAWHETAREAAERAKSRWVRLRADMALGAYRVYTAEGELPDPAWPGKPLRELIEIAFRDRVIEDPEHPVVRRLRGLS